jgi:serine/threonine protein kinase
LLASENNYLTANIDEYLRNRIWNDDIDVQFDGEEYVCPELKTILEMKKRLSGHEELLTQEDMTNVLSTQIDIYALGVTLYYLIFREKPPQDSILFGDM